MARKSPTVVELAIVLAILGILGSIVSNACRRSAAVLDVEHRRRRPRNRPRSARPVS